MTGEKSFTDLSNSRNRTAGPASNLRWDLGDSKEQQHEKKKTAPLLSIQGQEYG